MALLIRASTAFSDLHCFQHLEHQWHAPSLAECRIHAQRYGERSRQRLDLAILGFFQSFRRVYVGEQVMHSSKVGHCGGHQLQLHLFVCK